MADLPFQRLVRRLSLALVAAIASAGAAAWSQADFPFNLQRATNLARMKAERINGGLSVYRPAACMFDRAAGNCIVETSDQGILFRFLGGPPGWQQLNLPAQFETEIRVSPDGRSILSVVYNGPVRLSTP